MALDIKLKRSHTHSTIPTTSDLSEGEFAVNTYDRKLYMRDGSSNVVTVGNDYATDFESTTKTFYVTVATSTSAHVHHGSGSSNKYKINGVFSPYLDLIPGITYRFDQSDSSNSSHPFRFYLDENKSTSYTTGVTTAGTAGSAGAYTEIVVSHTTPAVLHYQCSAHGLMGWAAFVNTHNLTAFDTGDLTEGSNLYYTDARADARVNLQTGSNLDLSSKDTGDLSEGSNLYYTDARADARVNLQTGANLNLSSKDTDDLSEGSTNLYYTNARVDARITKSAIDALNVDADTLDSQDGTYYLNYNNFTNTPTIPSALTDLSISDGTSGQFLTTDGSGNFSFATLPTSGISNVVEDTTPQMGGDLDVNGNAIVSVSNGNIAITPNGTGSVIIDGLSHPQSDGNSGQVITTDGSGNLSFASVGSLAGAGISNVSDDTSPQLGGDLDVATHSIVSTSNRDINLTPDGTGNVVLDGLSYPSADGSANQVLTTDGSGSLSFADASSSSGENVSWSVTQSSHGLAVGDVIYNNGTNYVKAQADNTTTLGLFVVSAVADTNTFTASFSGKITLSSLTAGQYYFVSTTNAGDFVSTEPTSGYSNPILFALSTTEAVVLPYRPQDITSGGAAGGRTALDVFSKDETNAQISAFSIALG